jgi:hypothetical protein
MADESLSDADLIEKMKFDDDDEAGMFDLADESDVGEADLISAL